MPLSAFARLLLRPDVPVAVLRIGVAPRLLKPGMLVRRVIHDEIDEHPDAALLRGVREFDEIAERAVSGIDAVVIGDVVAVVACRRGLKRHQPHAPSRRARADNRAAASGLGNRQCRRR